MIRSLSRKVPKIAESAWLSEAAHVVGLSGDDNGGDARTAGAVSGNKVAMMTPTDSCSAVTKYGGCDTPLATSRVLLGIR